MMDHGQQKLIETIKKNSDMVYRLAFSQMKNKADADDVYQEVFLRFVNKKPSFCNENHEKAWFIRVTLNCAKTNLKSFWHTKTAELDENLEDISVEKEDLSFALKKLSKKHNAVLYLFYFEDMPVSEIAEAFDLSEPNVRMLLTRARRKLKEILEKEQYR